MVTSGIRLTEDKNFDEASVLMLYKLNKWSSANKPALLMLALKNAHTLVLAYHDQQLVGLGYAISDGYLVVYYPHVLVHPEFQGKGIGKMIMDRLQEKYANFHQQLLVADGKAIDFYKKLGFERAGQTEPLWIYQGDEH
jgi:ribosomal protein S18 acetylase RimI-like enzyme